MKKYLLILLAVLCCYGELYSAAVTAKTVIITTAKPTTTAQFAALELQYHLRLLTGTSIPITSEIPANTQLRIYVGDNPRYHSKDFASQEYLIETGADTVYLCGRDTEDFRKVDYTRENTFPGYWQENGSLYAVYDFLESLGVRWYLPTETGIAFTPTKNLEIPELKIRRTPSYIFRDTMALNIPADLCGDTVGERSKVKLLDQRERVLWYLRQRHGGKRMELNHSLYTYYPRFYPARKELFSLGYEANKDMQLCYTNPEVIAQVVQDARDFFDGKLADVSKVISSMPKNYRSDLYPLGAMDNSRWCKCGKCQELIQAQPKRGRGFTNDSASDYWFTFVATVANEIKKSHPDKLVGSLAYSSYAYPPEKVELPDNVLIRPAMHVWRSYSKTDMDEIQDLLRQWKEHCPQVKKMVSIWYCFPNHTAQIQKTRLFPHFLAHHVETYFKWFRDFGAIGMFWEPSYVIGGDGVMFDMVDGYINWKLAWNNELSAEQLFNEFFTKFYGPAAEPMRNFYELAEKVYSDPANYPPDTVHHNEGISWNRLGTAEVMDRLGGYVRQATAAATVEPFKARMELFNNGLWRYMREGKTAADAAGKAALATNESNLLTNGGFDDSPVGTLPPGWQTIAKTAEGGITGNALELILNVSQNQWFRSCNNTQQLPNLKSGKYRLTGFAKGEFDSVWVGIYGTGADNAKATSTLRKGEMRNESDNWYSFRFDFTMPTGVAGGHVLWQCYGPQNNRVLVDNLQILPVANKQ